MKTTMMTMREYINMDGNGISVVKLNYNKYVFMVECVIVIMPPLLVLR